MKKRTIETLTPLEIDIAYVLTPTPQPLSDIKSQANVEQLRTKQLIDLEVAEGVHEPVGGELLITA